MLHQPTPASTRKPGERQGIHPPPESPEASNPNVAPSTQREHISVVFSHPVYAILLQKPQETLTVPKPNSSQLSKGFIRHGDRELQIKLETWTWRMVQQGSFFKVLCHTYYFTLEKALFYISFKQNIFKWLMRAQLRNYPTLCHVNQQFHSWAFIQTKL